ncbi:hypothethical protein (plasmid) [Ralstonia solanacearum PSI07]|nr:hypothethical protein [Ralstonia solanacearum PSI07]
MLYGFPDPSDVFFQIASHTFAYFCNDLPVGHCIEKVGHRRMAVMRDCAQRS